jgi:hypothetical protein
MKKERFLSLALFFTAVLAAPAATLTGSFSSVAAGADVNLTVSGKLDWVHWGSGGDYSVNRKSGVTKQISDFSIISQNFTNNPLTFSSPYWFDDPTSSSCSWADGNPVIASTNNYTRVLAYSYPVSGGSGFKLTVPADTTPRVLTVFVGTIGSRGEFQATLTGTPGYSHSPIETDVNGVYTITYAANSPGQTLTITWTQPFSQTNGSVTLQAAALTAPEANNPPFAILTTPLNDATFAAPTNVLFEAAAQDFDGTVTNVSFYANAVILGQKAIAPYSLTWSNAPLGRHLLTAVATDNAGVSRTSVPAEIFVHGANGNQLGSLAVPPATVDLTVEGTADWSHWGLMTNTSIDRKLGVPAQISNFTPLGTAAVQRYTDNYSAFTWTDGTPTTATGGTTTGIFISGKTNGFSLSLPADTSPRTARIYVGAYAGRGHFLAYLSDFSAQPYIDTSIDDLGWDNEYAVYEITYSAATPGQQLNVIYRSLDLYDAIYGNVTLQAATLQSGLVGPLPVHLFNPARRGNDFILSFNTAINRSYTVQYSDQLPAPAWSNLTVVAGNGASVTVTNFNVPSGQRFYRVQTE